MVNKLRKRNAINRKKVLVFLLVLIAMFGINVGYSYLETMLLINANVEIDPYLRAKVDTEILGVPMTAYLDDRPSPYVETKISTLSASSDTNGKGLYLLSSTKNDENPIYYFRGDVSNNNVLFANKCWKMVRTTDTGGTKMIYNGEVKNIVSTSPVQYSEYINVVNDNTNQFTYDEATNLWSSVNHEASSTSAIEFNIATEGEYYLKYSLSTEQCCDRLTIYVDDVQVGDWGGIVSDNFFLGNLTTTNIIKVTYSKDGSVDNGDDLISFAISTKSGQDTISCDNTGSMATIGSSNFYRNNDSPAYVGYMRGVNETTSTKDYEYATIEDDGTFVYGSDIIWDGTTFTLQDTKVGADKNHHYSCLNAESSCTEVAYIIYIVDGKNMEYLLFKDGKNLDAAKEEMFSNNYDSNIKIMIDNWYQNNLLDYSEYLEDAIWCNDRRILGGSLLTNRSAISATIFGTSTSSGSIKDKLACPSVNDRFTIDENNGNGALKYPIGLLTKGEAKYAGLNNSDRTSTSYLISGSDFYTMTPSEFEFVRVNFSDKDGVYDISTTLYGGNVMHQRGGYGTIAGHDGILYVIQSDSYSGVRPVISIKRGISASTGDGSVTNPYIIN